MIEGPTLRSPAFATKKGIRGISPKMPKLKNVTILFVKGLSSSGISCSSQIIITYRKPFLFVDRICTISSEISFFSPISKQSSFISSFSASKSFSISICSLFSSSFMYSASLLVAKQSATAMESPSAIKEDMPNAITTLAPVLEPMPDRAMMRVVHMPSRPPQTADLMYSPPEMCFSKGEWELTSSDLFSIGGSG